MELELDQRKSRRLLYEAVIWHDNLLPDIFYSAKMYNLSNGGVYFESDQVIYPGEDIYLTLKNPTPPVNDKQKYIHVEIKWCKDLPSSTFRFGYGAKFINPIDTLVKSFDKVRFRKPRLQDRIQKYQKDPRRHPRKAYRKSLLFSSKNRNYKGLTTNISRGGAFIATNKAFTLGQMIHITIPGGRKNEDVKLKGWIVRLNPKGIGVKFDRRTARARRKVADRRKSRKVKTAHHDVNSHAE